MADSIRAQVQRSVLDSLLRMQSRVAMASPAGEGVPNVQVLVAEAEQVAREAASFSEGARVRPVRRVVVAPPRPQRVRTDLDAAARALTDSLRAAIDRHPRYAAVPLDSVRAVLAETRTVNAVQERLDADVVISLSMVPAGDSVARLLQIRDLAAPEGFNLRVVASSVAASEPTAGLQYLVGNSFRALLQMERGTLEFGRMSDGRNAPAQPRPPRTPRPEP